MITKEFIESLGWTADFLWDDKMMFSYKNSNYSIFEYNGDWGIQLMMLKIEEESINCNDRKNI